MDRRGGRVQTEQPRNGGSDVGTEEKQAHHELRETQQGAPILLRWRHDCEGLNYVYILCVVEVEIFPKFWLRYFFENIYHGHKSQTKLYLLLLVYIKYNYL